MTFNNMYTFQKVFSTKIYIDCKKRQDLKIMPNACTNKKDPKPPLTKSGRKFLEKFLTVHFYLVKHIDYQTYLFYNQRNNFISQ